MRYELGPVHSKVRSAPMQWLAYILEKREEQSIIERISKNFFILLV
jgi:hypothetical protein